MATKVKDLHELKTLASREDGFEGYISLNGSMRSSKRIFYSEESGLFSITNEIDDSEQELTSAELWSQSNIGSALDAGALFNYDFV